MESARRYLERLLCELKATSQSRLPGVKAMARIAGVSHGAMSGALAELKRSGALEVRPGKGTVIAQAAEVAGTVLPEGTCRWHRLTARMRRELADGLFGDTRLPSQKELMARYGVAQRTLVKALTVLAAEGTLEPSGGTFRPAAPPLPRARNTLVLFSRGGPAGELVVYTPRTTIQFSALEQLCAARDVRLQVVLCHFDGARLTFPGWQSGSLAEVFDPGKVLGFMVWRLGLLADFTAELVARLHGLGRPIAVFVESQDDLQIPGLPVDRLVRRYSTAPDFEAGRAVGRFLISRGHRRVCCWSEGSALQWCRERLAGIRHAFAGAGMPDAVESLSAWTDEYLYDAAEVQRVNDRLRRAVQQVSRELAVPIRPERETEVVSGLYFSGIYRELVFRALEPRMREALRSRRATAWVGTADPVAIECLRYLQASGAGVPEEISVVGFDDSPDAATRRLTSYNFNGAAAVNRMVDFLLWPDAPITRSGAGVPVMVDGFVHERATTGPAPSGPTGPRA